jgi:hypothetical protein
MTAIVIGLMTTGCAIIRTTTIRITTTTIVRSSAINPRVTTPQDAASAGSPQSRSFLAGDRLCHVRACESALDELIDADCIGRAAVMPASGSAVEDVGPRQPAATMRISRPLIAVQA